MRRPSITTLAVSLSVSWVAVVGVGVSARTPLSKPTKINKPGSYVVVRDIRAPGTDAFVIDVPTSAQGPVTIDLGGHTIIGSIRVNGIDNQDVLAREIAIVNGNIVGSLYGPYKQLERRIRIEKVTLTEGSVDFQGMAAFSLADCDIHGNVRARNGDAPFQGRVVDSRLGGLDLSPASNAIVRGNNVASILIEQDYFPPKFMLISENVTRSITVGREGGTEQINNMTITNNTVHGEIAVFNGAGAQIIGNNVFPRDAEGIQVRTAFDGPARGAQIANNLITGGPSAGISVRGGGVLVEDNQVQGNAGCGLKFANLGSNPSTDSVYRNNVLLGNAGGSVCGEEAVDAGGNVVGANR